MGSLVKKENWLTFIIAALFFLFPIFLAASNLFLALIVITWTVTLKNKNYIDIIRSNKVIWALGGLYVMVIIGTIFTPANSHWVLIHLKKYTTLLFSIILILLLTNREDLQKVATNAFIAAMILILISTWLNIWFLLPWSKSQNLGWGKTHHVVGSYITQNIMMAFFTIIALHKAISANKKIYKISWAVISILALISITHLSAGRTGILMVTAGIISYILVITRGKWLAIGLIAALFTIAITIGYSSIIKNRILQAVEEAQRHNVDHESSIGHRLYNYKTTSALIIEKPIFGHGTGAYHTEIEKFIERSSNYLPYEVHPHNQFLFFGADHGIVGIAIYALLLLSLYRTAFLSINPDAKAWLCVLATIFLLDSLINSALYSSRHSQFYGYMIALLVSMSMSNHNEGSKTPAIN